MPDGVTAIRFSDYVRAVFQEHLPSRKGIKKAIKRGCFLIDGEIATTGRWIEPGQVIELLIPDHQPRKIFKLKMAIPFEDKWIAVVHKPAGFIVSGNKFMTIQNALLHNLSLSTEVDALQLPRPVHRLDRSTSGLLMVAKTATAAMKLGQQFEAKTVEKRYRAIVAGQIDAAGTITSPIDGRSAVSHYRCINDSPSAKYGYLSRVDLFPETGRTHQLRIHMARTGNEIIGDKLYGTKGTVTRRQGLFLCAVAITFQHPVTEETMTVTIDEPAKFQRYMQREALRPG